MGREAALIAVSCVLFVQMGLAGAVQETLHFKSRILSCPKCLTFWSVLLWDLAHGTPAVLSVAASFILSYAALWMALALDGLTVLYNALYDAITETTEDTTETAAPGDGPQANDAAPAADEVPQM